MKKLDNKDLISLVEDTQIIQLMGIDGNPLGIYVAEKGKSVSEIQDQFDAIFEEASIIEEDVKDDEDWDIHTYVDGKMSILHGVVRVYVSEVTTNSI